MPLDISDYKISLILRKYLKLLTCFKSLYCTNFLTFLVFPSVYRLFCSFCRMLTILPPLPIVFFVFSLILYLPLHCQILMFGVLSFCVVCYEAFRIPCQKNENFLNKWSRYISSLIKYFYEFVVNSEENKRLLELSGS